MDPKLDLEALALGPLHLGEPLSSAASLGRPRRIEGRTGSEVAVYDGFELEFAANQLVCVTFNIDAESAVGVGDFTLTRRTKPLDALVWFGEPASDSGDNGGLRWIDFARGAATFALEFDAGGLTCVQLYAEGYA